MSLTRNQSLLGIACFAVGMFLFAAVDTIAKLLTDTLHPIQVAWSRQIGLLIGTILVLLWKGPSLLRSDHKLLQISRGACAAASAVCFILAIAHVPLADAVAVSFVAPFMVTIMGAVILGEQVGPRRWIAVAAGFVACLIIIRPGFGVFHPAIFLILLAVTFYATRQTLSRKLSGSDPTMTTIAYTALSAGILISLPLPFIWKTPPTGQAWLFVGMLALLAGAAEIFVIRALELAQTVVLAPVHYTLLIWGTFYGWFIFGDLPDAYTWTGAAIIVVTGLYVVHREYLAKQRRP